MYKKVEYTEINPIDKKDEICKLLINCDVKYEIHDNPLDEDYNYLEEGDLCITVINPTSEYPLYIDLEDMGEFTLSYYGWHNHYMSEKWDYGAMMDDLKNILNNMKCLINIYSGVRWLSSNLSPKAIGKDYDYRMDLNNLPTEFRKEITETKGRIELVYWDKSRNAVINL